ncbi:hypothetical protein BKA58DRAFT_6435 [Alternaria rosae]|uniref:uncharacterized protein n=1 Tax=Alternaria rosae TaxID=1187941 RepID=UPI001E8D06B2|nr:uncharacterized protein BKA58DRAFT_6435 [Alternaria rosae]KAH6881678.1 hypothetical protein BKA58DRAFT_6435 [Alternaria rosae]
MAINSRPHRRSLPTITTPATSSAHWPMPSLGPRSFSCPIDHSKANSEKLRSSWWCAPLRMNTREVSTRKEPMRSDSPQGPPSPNPIDRPTVDPKAIEPKRLRLILTERFMKRRLEVGPRDLAPLHIRQHLIPWSMPNEEDLRMIFVPCLVKWIQESNYEESAPGRCFCSLVLHVLSKRLPDGLIHNDPIDRDNFRSRLGEIFSDDAMPLDHLLDYCANGYKMQKVRKIHKRPMTHNT